MIFFFICLTIDNTTDKSISSTVDEQRIVVRNSHGENLVGLLSETGSKVLVIICHGFQSKKVSLLLILI